MLVLFGSEKKTKTAGANVVPFVRWAHAKSLKCQNECHLPNAFRLIKESFRRELYDREVRWIPLWWML